MRATSLERPNPAQTVLVLTASLAALVLLGWVLAYWTWVWFAPRVEPLTRPAAPAEGRTAGSAGEGHALFGGIRRDGSRTAPAAGAITLLGVVAATHGRSGYAVLRLDGKQTLAVPQGAEVEPGLRLVDVQADRVVLERNGVREPLAWPQKAGK